MTPVRRWCVVALLVALVVAVPTALRLRPVGAVDADTATLVEQVRGSASQPWSGYAETSGTVQLPGSGDLGDVASLLGSQSRLRAWWADAGSWRVDRLLVAGEQDLVHRNGRTTSFDYERAEAVTSRDPDIRLPRASDVLPATLARTVLDGADAAEVTRIDDRRVAGVAAAGLRVTPSSPASTIDHADLWVDPATGIALRVEVVADGSSEPDFTTALASYEPGPPDPEHVRLDAADSVEQSFEEALDIAGTANQYAPLRPPGSAAGLARSSDSVGAVGVYGEGLTQLIAIPLRDREAGPLRDQLLGSPGVVSDRRGTGVAVGLLGVYLTGGDGDGGWLLAGSVTADTLRAAARDIGRGTVYLGYDG